jgi:ABC-type uncharacterized transport system substrate-binding protein
MGIRVMSRRPFLAGMCALGASIVAMEPLASCSRLPIRVAPRPPPIRLGFLGPADPHTEHGWFSQALQKLNDRECRSYDIDYERPSDASSYVAQATQLVRRRPAVILTQGEAATAAAIDATGTVPIVLSMVDDPVEKGFVASLARPGGNITGLSSLAPELSGKRLELLKETVPKLSRVAVFGTSTTPDNAQSLKEVELAAGAFGMKLQYLDVLDPKDIETAFRAAGKGRADAVLWLVAGGVTGAHRTEIAELAVKSRIPVIYDRRESVEAGGLMTYGVNVNDLDRRAATYVDRILKGAKPAELPVEQPTKFELIINLKAAKQIGLTIPPNVLARADKVIN